MDSKTSTLEAPGRVQVQLLPRLLLPNLGVMLAAATLVYCLFVFNAPQQLFRDSDTGWHIRTGEWILDHGALPQSDPYSFSKAGEPWIAWEWGSDVLMALAHRWNGLRGVTSLYVLAIFACTWLFCRLQFAAGGDFLLTAALAPLIVTTASLHWLARPHVLSWLLLLAALIAAESYSAHVPLKRRWLHVAGTAALAALWANLHASFFLAPVIAAVYAAGELIRPALWKLESWDQWRSTQRARWFALLAIASLAGTLANPFGWRLHAHVISYLRNEDLTARIAEFQSFNFHSGEATQVVLALLLGVAGGLVALSQRRVSHFLLMTLFVWGGLRSARGLPLVALAVLPLANGAFAEILQRTRWQRLVRYSEGLRKIDSKITGVIFAAVTLGVMMIAVQGQTPAFPSDRFPVNAAEAVAKLPVEARVFASDSFGGYLIYRFNSERKVFFDGRSDFYGVEFMKQYLTLSQARPGWQEIARSYRFTHALVPKDSALRAALEQSGWATMHQDNTAVLLEAR